MSEHGILSLTLIEEDNGCCRVYYRNPEAKRLYCFQLEQRSEFNLFECTAEGEPAYPIDLTMIDVELSEVPRGETKIGREMAEWWAELKSSQLTP